MDNLINQDDLDKAAKLANDLRECRELLADHYSDSAIRERCIQYVRSVDACGTIVSVKEAKKLFDFIKTGDIPGNSI